MSSTQIIEAPSVLGLHPGGVAKLPQAFRKMGFHAALREHRAVVVKPPRYSEARSAITGLKNEKKIAEYARRLAATVGACVDRGDIPIVLGGDCSIVLGPLLALRKRGHSGLVYFDGHTSFHSAKSSGSGEVADMDLAMACGRGEGRLARLHPAGPLVREEDILLIGARDGRSALSEGSPDIAVTAIRQVSEFAFKQLDGFFKAQQLIRSLGNREDLNGYWLHLDVDVISDRQMKAVDYRMPRGLSMSDVGALIRQARRSGRMQGISVTIYNPDLDPGLVEGAKLERMLRAALVDSAP